MADERALLSLQRLRGPVDPDGAFSDALFEQLTSEIDFERGVLRRRRPSIRVRPAPLLGERQRRVAWLMAAAALVLLGLLLAIVLTGGVPSPKELVRRSQLLDVNPTAFDATVRMTSLTVRYRYDGAGMLRGDVVDARPGASRAVGSHFLFDGAIYEEYAADGSFAGRYAADDQSVSYENALPWGPLAFASADRSSPLAAYPLTWTLPRTFEQPPLVNPCDPFEPGSLETIAGRSAREVRCRQELQAWIDVNTARLLKVNWGGGQIAEEIASDPYPKFDHGLFDLEQTKTGLRPLVFGQMPPGRYDSIPFTPEVEFQLGDGWAHGGAQSGYVNLDHGTVNVAISRVDGLIDPVTGRDLPFVGDSLTLTRWLQGHPSLSIGAPSPVSLIGASGFRFPLKVRDDAVTQPCKADPASPCIALFTIDGVGEAQLDRGASLDVMVLDVHGRVVLVIVEPLGSEADQLDMSSILSFP
jgi:hypothetical protein